jgi:hypothetical protein
MKNKEMYINKFLSKIDKVSDCWIWKGSKHLFGYGQFCINGKPISAHRAAWILFRENIPKGFNVCHNCPSGDNPACCNPDHLFLATQGDNIRDIFKKNRGNPPSNERCRTSILTKEKVLEMRLLKEKFCVKTIAKMFGVSPTTALYAINGKTWKNI